MTMNSLKMALKGEKLRCYSNVREVIISDDVESIAVEAFAYLPYLMKINFGAKIHEIPSKCCAGCNLLQEIKFSKDTESIGTAAFCGINPFKRAIFETITSDINKAKYFQYEPSYSTDYAHKAKYDVIKYRENKQYNRFVELPPNIKKLGKLAFGATMSFYDNFLPRYELLVSDKQWNEFKEVFEGSGRRIIVKFSDKIDIMDETDGDTRNKLEKLHLAKHDERYDDWTRRLEKIYIANSNNSGIGEARKKDTDIKQIGDIKQMRDNDEEPSI